MGEAAKKLDEHWTYRNYKTWPDDERWELIDGVAYDMSPAPNRRHQGILARLARQVLNFLDGKPCVAYFAPFDVLLPSFPGQDEDDIDTVVEPDLVVYCDRAKLTYAGATGAPDLAVEILSPRTTKKDISIKFARYERAGVKEYWIIDPGNRCVHQYCLDESGRYGEESLVLDADILASKVLEGFSMKSAELFAES